MKHWSTGTAALTLLAGVWLSMSVTLPASETPGYSSSKAAALIAQLPLWFEPNRGQASPGVEFLARGPGYGLFLSPTEIGVSLKPLVRSEPARASVPTDPGAASLPERPLPVSIRLRLLNANPSPHLTGCSPLESTTHYFIGNDSTCWQRDVPNYGKVQFESVYPGVDLVFYGKQRQLEFDFIVAPGADPQPIEFAVEGSTSLQLDAGNLVIVTSGGNLVLQKPEVFQEGDRGRVNVPGEFVLGPEGRVRFSLGPYDVQRPLVIDPILSYSTYFGGTDFDRASAIALDADGNICMVGETRSPNFIPTPLGTGTVGGIFIAKLRPDGSAPVFSVYLAGSNPGTDLSTGDEAGGIAVDAQGSILVCGRTSSPSFPVRNAFQPIRNGDERFKAGSDGFVTKLTPTGNDLVYSTFLGGSYQDAAKGIVVDATGAAFVTGSTYSTNFPTSSDALAPTIHGPLFPAPVAEPKPSAGNSDAFITRFSPNGALLYSTYFGGSYNDAGNGIALDSAGTIHVVGTTGSSDLPTTESAYQKNFQAPEDGFFLKLNATGNQVRYLTYFGGNAGLEIRPRVLAFGLRGVSDVTTNGVLRLRNPGSRPVTITFFDQSQGSSRVTFPNLPPVPFSLSPGEEFPLEVNATIWSGFAAPYRLAARVEGAGPKESKFDVFFAIVGRTSTASDEAEPIATGIVRESVNAIALDPANNVYIAGTFNSHDFPMKGVQRPVVEKQFFGDRAFAAKFDSTSSLLYSLILSGESSDSATGIAADEAGNAYVVGSTSSEQFPLVEALQSALGGTAGQFGFPSDAFVTKLSPNGDQILFSTFLGGAESDNATSVAVDAMGTIVVAGASTSGDFPVTNAFQSTFASLPKKDIFGLPFLVPDAFVAMISQTQATEEIQVWQSMEVPRPASNPGLARLNEASGPANFRVVFSRLVGGVRIEAEAEVIAVTSSAIRFRVPVDLLGPSDVPAPPLGLDPNVTLEVFSVPDGRLLVRQRDLRLRLPQPIIVDELDVRLDPAAIRNLLQFVLTAPSPRNHTFVFLGRSSDGSAGLRVLNTALSAPQPLRFELDDLVVFEPNPATGRFRRIATPFHIPNLGPGNQGIQFNVSQNGLHVIAVEANTNSPGPFPARYQLHLAANVGLPQRLINGVTEFQRGTRLDTLFNHPAPRTHGLLSGEVGAARTALFKFANVATVSQFAQAVLLPPSAGFASGVRIVRATDPATPLGLTTPTARTPENSAPVIGTVLDWTQIPIPESLAQPPPPAGPLTETVGAVLGQNDGNGLTLPKAFAGNMTVSSVILDMGSGSEIVDGAGADLEILATTGSYTVRVGNTPYADSFSAAVGPFSGVRQLDLGASGLRSARYVWIIPAPSVVLDAVRSLNVFADEISSPLGAISHVRSASITVRRAKAASNLLDPFVQLIAPNGDLLGEDEAGFGDDLSPDLSDAALVNRALPQAGFYRYLVKGYDKQPDNQSSGTFFTRLETGGTYDPVELAVSPASEEQTAAQKSGSISTPRQRDSFLFVAEPGKVLNIVVNARNAPAEFDPVVELYDSEDFLMGASDNGGGSRGRNPALLNVTLPATTQGGSALPNPSTYRVVVTALDSFGNPTPFPIAGSAHVRQAISGSYELKVFTGLPSGGVSRPRIDTVNPTRGSAGTSVLLSGADFSPIASANLVRFGNTPASITSASATQIVTAVPAGLAPGTVSLTVSVGDQTSASADFTVTASPVVPSGPQTAQARLYSESIRFHRASATSEGDAYTLELTSLPESEPPNGELYPTFSSFGEGTHSANFLLSGTALSEGLSGTLTLDAPILIDQNNNEIPDLYEIGMALSATTSGDYASDFDEGTIGATWSRAPNSKTGTCRLLLTSDSLGVLPEFAALFEIAEYLGTFRYGPSAGLVQASLEVLQTGSPANSLKGIVTLEKEPADPSNTLSFEDGTLTNGAGRVLTYFPGFLQRSSNVLSNYSTPITFDDGDPSTTLEDYFDWTLVITDPNDADGDRTPDLSDSIPAPPAALQVNVSVDLATRTLILAVNGPVGATVDLEETPSLANPAWAMQSSVTLGAGLSSVRLPLSGGVSRFYRARLR